MEESDRFSFIIVILSSSSLLPKYLEAEKKAGIPSSVSSQWGHRVSADVTLVPHILLPPTEATVSPPPSPS